MSENELSILEVLWEHNKPLQSAGVVNLCIDKQLKSSSIHRIINNLLDKGDIMLVGFERAGRTFSRTFIHSDSISDETLNILEELIKQKSVNATKIIYYNSRFLKPEIGYCYLTPHHLSSNHSTVHLPKIVHADHRC